MRNDLTQEQVKKLFDYDPETGWLINRAGRYKAKAGTQAGCVDWQGYRGIKIRGPRYLSGRLIWLWMTGKWPEHEIDHINLVRDDDRWCNLREASRSQNCANKGQFFKPNKYGFRGVKRGSQNRFSAVICRRQKEVQLGLFPTPEMAALAYDVAAKKEHGQYARFNFPEKAHRDWLIP